MKKLTSLFLLLPILGMAQLNFTDLTFLANNKFDKNVEYLQSKGYSFRQERPTEDGSKQVYYEKGKMNRTMFVMRVGRNSNVILSSFLVFGLDISISSLALRFSKNSFSGIKSG